MILVVDSDPAFLEKAREILNREHQVFLASTERQAYKLAQDLAFSVVLVDLNMKGSDGLIRKIRENMPGLPVIAIADNLQKASCELVDELGVTEILRKPITTEWKPVVERVRAMKARA